MEIVSGTLVALTLLVFAEYLESDLFWLHKRRYHPDGGEPPLPVVASNCVTGCNSCMDYHFTHYEIVLALELM